MATPAEGGDKKTFYQNDPSAGIPVRLVVGTAVRGTLAVELAPGGAPTPLGVERVELALASGFAVELRADSEATLRAFVEGCALLMTPSAGGTQ